MRALVRGPAFVAVLGGAVLGALVLRARYGPSPRLLRARVRWVHRVSPYLLRSLGITERSPERIPVREAGMTVANHISYVDVLLIAAALPTVFVTSTEVRDTPGLGFLCRMAGCAFVDRRSARGLRGEIAALASVVRSGFHVAVFPEATSTRGDRVLPFKAALFEAARLSGRPLRAAVVEYDANVLPHISYAGDDRFLPHLVRLLGSRSTNAQVRWVAVDAAPAALHARELAEWAHAAIVRGRTLPAANDGGAPPDSVRPRHEHRSIRPRPTTN